MKRFALFLVLALMAISANAQLPPILRQYFTTNAHVLSNGAGALTNNGTGTLGWLALTNFGTSGEFILRSNGFGTNTTLVSANGTNGLVVIDTAEAIAPFDVPKLAALRNNGTNILTIYGGGGILMGRTAFDFWGVPFGESLVSVFDSASGEPFYNELDILSYNSTNGNWGYGKIDVEQGGTARFFVNQRTAGVQAQVALSAGGSSVGIFAEYGGQGMFALSPGEADESGNASNYYFDTLNPQTNSWLVRVLNDSTTKFGVRGPGNIYSAALTPSTVLQANSSTNIESIANGTGALTNNGSGGLGWYDLTTLAPATGGKYIATNNGTGFATTFYGQTNVGAMDWTNGAQVLQLKANELTLTNSNIKLPTNSFSSIVWGDGITNASIKYLTIGAGNDGEGLGFYIGVNPRFWIDPSGHMHKASGRTFSLAGSGSVPSMVDSGSDLVIAGNIVSSADKTYNLGNSTTHFKGEHVSSIFRGRFATNASWTINTNFYVQAWTAIAVVGTVTLPSASTCSNLHILIKDEGGNTSATNLTIAVQSGDRIDGATTATINNNYGAKNVYSAGSTNWFIF